MINKKAGAFAIGMTIAVAVLIGLTLYCFVLADRKIISDLNTFENLTDSYREQERLAFYVQETARLSTAQAFYVLANESAINKSSPLCTVTANKIIIWNEACKPEAVFIEEKFLEEYNKTFYLLLNKYPKKINLNCLHILDNNIMKSEAATTFTLTERASYALYNISYEAKLLTETDLAQQGIHLDDFESIYQQVMAAKKECQGEKIVECFNSKLELEHWNTTIEKQGSYLIFKLKTKKAFFFEQQGIKFAPLELSFALI